MEHLKLSDGEWKLMKVLWNCQPQTLAELVAALDADTGWSRATIFMMLKRLIAKGAVTMDDSGKFQKYSAAVAYADVEPEETESFLSKVYGGSVGHDGIELSRTRRAVGAGDSSVKSHFGCSRTGAFAMKKRISLFDTLHRPAVIRLPENTGGFTSSAAGGTSMGNRIAGCTAVLHSVFHRDPHV